MPLSENEISARIRIGQQFCKRFVANDLAAAQKFRDASNVPAYFTTEEEDDDFGGDVPADMPVGQSNMLATNIITKVAAIAIGNPDWFVTTGSPDTAPIVRLFLKEKWRLSNWVRLTQKALLKRSVSGLGIMAYRFDPDKRTCFEHVQVRDLSLDPHTRDFSELRWAARRIKLPLRDAIQKYGDKYFPQPQSLDDGALDRGRVEIWLYFDKAEEIHLYDNKVLYREANAYKRVPLLFLEGDQDPNPNSIWPLGDYQLVAGLQAELSDINARISRMAKHGGSINLVNVDMLGKGGMEALENGVPEGFIPVKDLVTPPIERIPGEQLMDTLLEAKREVQQAIDAIMGVNQYMRGVIQQSSKFATETAYIANQSGARAVQSRLEFERFLDKMAEIVILLEQEFGGPRPGYTTDEEYVLWQALMDTQEVRVIESSTAYKDPSFEQQQALQALNLIAGLVPLFIQTGQPVIPNVKTYVDDYLRASGQQDANRHWMPAPQMPGQVPGGSPLPPGAAPMQPAPNQSFA